MGELHMVYAEKQKESVVLVSVERAIREASVRAEGTGLCSQTASVGKVVRRAWRGGRRSRKEARQALTGRRPRHR